jgi:hypothetical protein
MMVTDNTCPIVQVYFFEKIYVSHWDHSEVCPRLVSLQGIRGNYTRRHNRSTGVAFCNVVKGPTSHCEALRTSEKGPVIPRSGANQTRSNILT